MTYHYFFQNNNTVTKLVRIALFIVLPLMAASCNLFIEDELDEGKESSDVPVHTGYGYDEPVRETNEYYDITYQFNSNVLRITPEMEKYIQEVRYDSTGVMGCIDFDISMPEELRPVKGEIIHSAITSKFRFGIAHEVMAAAEVDGVYRLITLAAEPNQVFKKFSLDADITSLLAQQQKQTYNATRDFWDETDYRKSDPYEGEGSISANLGKGVNFDVLHRDWGHGWTSDVNVQVQGSFKINKFHTKHALRLQIRGRDLKIKEVPWTIAVTDDYVFDGDIEFNASAKVTWTIENKNILPPDKFIIQLPPGNPAITCPVILGIRLIPSVEVAASGHFFYNLNGHAEKDLASWSNVGAGQVVDLIRDPLETLDPLDLRRDFINRDNSYFGLTIEGTATGMIELHIIAGLGLWSDKIGGCVVLAGNLKTTAESTVKSITGTGFLGNGYNSFAKQQGVTTTWDAGLGAEFRDVHDLKLVIQDFFKNIGNMQLIISTLYANFFLDEEERQEYLSSANELSEKIKGLAGTKNITEIIEKSELAATVVGPYYITEHFEDLPRKTTKYYWMPKMDDNSWHFTKNGAGQSNVQLSMGYSLYKQDDGKPDIGIDARHGQVLTPCIVVLDEGMDYVDMVFSNERITKDFDHCEITFPYFYRKIQPNKIYFAMPGYYAGEINNLGKSHIDMITSTGRLEDWVASRFYFDKEQRINTIVSTIQVISLTHLYTYSLDPANKKDNAAMKKGFKYRARCQAHVHVNNIPDTYLFGLWDKTGKRLPDWDKGEMFFKTDGLKVSSKTGNIINDGYCYLPFDYYTDDPNTKINLYPVVKCVNKENSENSFFWGCEIDVMLPTSYEVKFDTNGKPGTPTEVTPVSEVYLKKIVCEALGISSSRFKYKAYFEIPQNAENIVEKWVRAYGKDDKYIPLGMDGKKEFSVEIERSWNQEDAESGGLEIEICAGIKDAYGREVRSATVKTIIPFGYTQEVDKNGNIINEYPNN